MNLSQAPSRGALVRVEELINLLPLHLEFNPLKDKWAQSIQETSHLVKALKHPLSSSKPLQKSPSCLNLRLANKQLVNTCRQSLNKGQVHEKFKEPHFKGRAAGPTIHSSKLPLLIRTSPTCENELLLNLLFMSFTDEDEEDDRYGFEINNDTEKQKIPEEVQKLWDKMYRICAKELFVLGR